MREEVPADSIYFGRFDVQGNESVRPKSKTLGVWNGNNLKDILLNQSMNPPGNSRDVGPDLYGDLTNVFSAVLGQFKKEFFLRIFQLDRLLVA